MAQRLHRTGAPHLVRLLDLAAQPRNKRSLLRGWLPVRQGWHLHALLIFRLRRVSQLCAARRQDTRASGGGEQRAARTRHALVQLAKRGQQALKLRRQRAAS